MPESPLRPVSSSGQTGLCSLLALSPGQGGSGEGRGQEELTHKLPFPQNTFRGPAVSLSEGWWLLSPPRGAAIRLEASVGRPARAHQVSGTKLMAPGGAQYRARP